MRFVILSFLLSGCANGVWRSADEACAGLRALANECHERTARVEKVLGAEWPSIAEVFPGSGEFVLAIEIDKEGRVRSAKSVESSAATDVVGEAIELVRKQTYADAKDRQLFVRFRMRPPNVTVVAPLSGDVSRVVDALRDRQDAYFKCYQDAARFEDKSFEGTLRVTIGEDGNVAEAALEAVSDLDEEFERCVLAEARKISLPARVHEGQTARLSLSYTPRPRQ